MSRITVSIAILLSVVGQVTRAQPEEGQYYRIKSVNSGKVVAAEGDSHEAGAKIIQATAKGKGDENHHWKLVKVGDHYKFVNRGSGKVLEVPNASKDDLVQIQQADDRGAKSKKQLWEFERIRGNEFAIKSFCSGFVLDVFEKDTKEGAPIVQHPLNAKGDRKNQLWEFVQVK